MRVLDLFSGIGGFSLGLERSGMKTVAFCEIKPFPRAVLRKHWPEVPIYEDVRTLTAERLAADGIAVDVICGGFPCQDISTAGKGAGIDGERSGLWREYARIIGELRPRYVIVENVAALLGRGLARVLGDMAALGYDAEWHCIPASAVGAPHRRDRLWIIAHPRGEQHESGCAAISRTPAARFLEAAMADADDQRQLQSQGRKQNQRRWLGDGSPNVADTGCEPAQIPIAGGQPAIEIAQRHTWWAVEPAVGRVAHGVPAELDGGEGGEKEHVEEACAESNVASHSLPGVRGNGRIREASPGLFDAGSGGSALSTLPHQSGPEGRHATETTAEGVLPLRQGVHADAQQEAQSMQPGMPFCRWPHERGETLGEVWSVEPGIGRVAAGVLNRLDRLKGLGNAVVPQIPEMIGRAIMQQVAA